MPILSTYFCPFPFEFHTCKIRIQITEQTVNLDHVSKFIMSELPTFNLHNIAQKIQFGPVLISFS